MTGMETTYDGLPIARDNPRIVCVVVYRDVPSGREILLMHRCTDGPGYEGDWAWTPPAGARFPDEDVLTCAQRELLEETGLALPVMHAPSDIEVCAVYVAKADRQAEILLNEEHDRFEWVTPAEAMARCKPDVVAGEIRAAMALLDGA